MTEATTVKSKPKPKRMELAKFNIDNSNLLLVAGGIFIGAAFQIAGLNTTIIALPENQFLGISLPALSFSRLLFSTSLLIGLIITFFGFIRYFTGRYYYRNSNWNDLRECCMLAAAIQTLGSIIAKIILIFLTLSIAFISAWGNNWFILLGEVFVVLFIGSSKAYAWHDASDIEINAKKCLLCQFLDSH